MTAIKAPPQAHPLPVVNPTVAGRSWEVIKSSPLRHGFFRVVNSKALDDCIERMAKQTELDPGARRFSMVYIHLSMHGNERGIGLTSGEILPWTELGDRLTDYSTRAGLIVQGTCLQTLCFSTCCGLYGRTMSIGKSISPFLAIVGSSQEVDWSDALTAFVAFYHSVPRPAISLAESVKRMNGAIGQHDLFELVCSDNVDSLADICCR